MSGDRLELRHRLMASFNGPLGEILHRQSFLPGLTHKRGEEMQFFRGLNDRIDVVGCRLLQRLGSSQAEIAVETGVFLKAVPHPVGADFRGFEGLSLRCSEDCHFRKRLKPSWRAKSLLSRQVSWIVAASGRGLESALADVARRIENTGLPWFEMFADPDAIYEAVRRRSQPGNSLPGPWGQMYGDRLVEGFLALRVSDWATARSDLGAVLDVANPRHLVDPEEPSRLYHRVRRTIEAALDTIRHSPAPPPPPI